MKDEIIKSYIEERNKLWKDIYSDTSWIDGSKKFTRLVYIDNILLKYLDNKPSDTSNTDSRSDAD